jgi:hypothetical protein
VNPGPTLSSTIGWESELGPLPMVIELDESWDASAELSVSDKNLRAAKLHHEIFAGKWRHGAAALRD